MSTTDRDNHAKLKKQSAGEQRWEAGGIAWRTCSKEAQRGGTDTARAGAAAGFRATRAGGRRPARGRALAPGRAARRRGEGAKARGLGEQSLGDAAAIGARRPCAHGGFGPVGFGGGRVERRRCPFRPEGWRILYAVADCANRTGSTCGGGVPSGTSDKIGTKPVVEAIDGDDTLCCFPRLVFHKSQFMSFFFFFCEKSIHELLILNYLKIILMLSQV
jgi:hypothetical protein